jgi:sec-independent protein translocase protein TatA
MAEREAESIGWAAKRESLDEGWTSSYILIMGSIGWQEILLVLVIVLLLFGAKRLPEIGRAIGKGIKEFKQGLREIDKDEEKK